MINVNVSSGGKTAHCNDKVIRAGPHLFNILFHYLEVGVSSVLMKFSDDIKLGGAVDTTEDGK